MWNIFSKIKPPKDGWYQCTVEVSDQQRYVMNLYWYGDKNDTGKFIDNIRANVCESYTVLSYDGSRLSDIGQDRTDSVIAWTNMPEPYMDGFKLTYKDIWEIFQKYIMTNNPEDKTIDNVDLLCKRDEKTDTLITIGFQIRYYNESIIKFVYKDIDDTVCINIINDKYESRIRIFPVEYFIRESLEANLSNDILKYVIDTITEFI